MSTAGVPNTTAAEIAPRPPQRPGGEPYTFEMIYDGGRWRGLLIHGYGELAEAPQQLAARIRYAAEVQVPVQVAAAAAGDLDACTRAQQEILLGHRDEAPAVSEWSAPVPLVLARRGAPGSWDAEITSLPEELADRAADSVHLEARCAACLLLGTVLTALFRNQPGQSCCRIHLGC
jgi:hypothetical protein